MNWPVDWAVITRKRRGVPFFLGLLVFSSPTLRLADLRSVTPVSSLRGPQSCDLDELVKHAMKALSGCVTGDKELDANGLTVAIVGKVGQDRTEPALTH